MKNLLRTFFIFCLTSITLYAQNDQSHFINYQGVASDASGNPIASTAINIQIGLHFGLPNAPASYIENHNPTTDANGLFTIKIGDGTLVSGVYDPDEFGLDASYITVSLNGSNLGTTEFNAVPFALSASDSPNNPWTIDSNGFIVTKETRVIDLSNGILIPYLSFDGDPNQSINGVSTDPTFSNPDDQKLPTQNATKQYIDNAVNSINTASEINDLSDGKRISNSIYLGQNAGASAQASLAYNVGIGDSTMVAITTAISNAAVGFESLKNTTTGSSNAAIGAFSLKNNTTGIGNTALGRSSMSSNTTGNFNTAIGRNALDFNTTGSGNVAIGYQAGYLEFGSNTLYIENSTSSAPLIYGEFDNNILRLNGTTEVRSFSSPTAVDLILGGTANSTTGDDGIISSDPDYAGSDIFLRSNDAVVVQLDYDDNENGEFDINNGAGTNILKVLETGNMTISGSLTQNSDRRLKKDIETIPYGLKHVLKLAPKSYHWKDKTQDFKSLGLIAQDVQDILPSLVTAQDDEQKTLGVNYIELIPVLIKAIQEQQLEIKTLKNENSAKNTALSQLTAKVMAIEKMLNSSNPNTLMVTTE